MKEVNFYTICDPYKKAAFMGGGPETYRQIINNIEECGYKVNLILPSNYQSPKDCSFFIMQDCWNDPGASPWYTPEQYSELLNSEIPFIVSECAYTGCSKLPYALNSAGSLDYENELGVQTRPFFQKARIILTTSPQHKNEIGKHLHLKMENAYCYFQEVDTTKFYNRNYPTRDIPYLYAGACTWAKGYDIVVNQFQNQGLLIAGNINPIPPEHMPEVYNRTQYLVHLPRWKEPFGRTVAEATLCGCKIIANDNVGALSYKCDLGDSALYTKSKEDFKQMIKDNFV